MFGPKELHPDDPLGPFVSGLTSYLEGAKAGTAPRHQLSLAHLWESSVTLTLQLRENPKQLGLQEAPQYLRGLPDIHNQNLYLNLPFKVFTDPELPAFIGKATDTFTPDLIAVYCDALVSALAYWYDLPKTIRRLQQKTRYPDRLPYDEENFYRRFAYPTCDFPQFACFLTDYNFRRLFETENSPWVQSGPTIWFTLSALENLSSGYAIEQNVWHEFLYHGLMQQRLLNHFGSSLEMTLAELEADIISGRQSSASFGPSRPPNLVQEMVNIQLNPKTLSLLKTAINRGLPFEQINNRQPQNYFLSSLAMHSFFEFVARKRLGCDITEYHHHDPKLAQVAYMDFITSGMSFEEWKKYHGWSDHKIWWDKFAQMYTLSYLPGVLSFEDLRTVLFNNPSRTVKDEAFASTFIEKYYRGVFGDNLPPTVIEFLTWLRRQTVNSYRDLYADRETTFEIVRHDGAVALHYLATDIRQGTEMNTEATAQKMFGPDE